jgi:ankyrin repeat protein
VDISLNTPLHIAAEKGHAEPLKLLLEHVKSDGSGCPEMKIDAKNVLNKTIMHLAAENGHLQ